MDLKLSSGEAIVKSWEYAQTKGWILTKGTSNLTVTNKRLISTTVDKRGLLRDEVSVDSIGSMTSYYHTNFSLLFILLGVILCLTIILIPFGTRLIQLGSGTELMIIVDGVPSNAIVASSSIKRRRNKSFRLKVSKAAAKEICETLSTLVFVELKN